MKLNINAKELLALHNLLYERFDGGCAHDKCESDNTDDSQLRQVYNRLRACIVAGLTNKQLDPVETFLSREQAKIDRLKDQNDEVKRDQVDFATDMARSAKDILVPGEGEDFNAPDYPRRGPRGPRGNRGGGGKR